MNLDAALGIAATLQAQGRRAEAAELIDVAIDPLLDRCAAIRAQALERRKLASKLFEVGGEMVADAAMNSKVETWEDFGGAVGLGVFGVWMRAAAVGERRSVEEALRRNTPVRWLLDLADECYARKSWAGAYLLYRRLEEKGGVPGEPASFQATLKARIVECEAKFKEETI